MSHVLIEEAFAFRSLGEVGISSDPREGLWDMLRFYRP
jgi:hypothetical protein